MLFILIYRSYLNLWHIKISYTIIYSKMAPPNIGKLKAACVAKA